MANDACNSPGSLEEPLLTTSELADRLSCSERSIRRWRESGLIRAIKTPGLVRFRLSEVLHDLTARQQ